MWTFADVEEETTNPEQDIVLDSPWTQAPAEWPSQVPS